MSVMIDAREYPLPARRRVAHDNSCYHASVAGWRSSAARELAEAVKTAGGTVERAGRGKLIITGPAGKVTIQEPASDTRRDLRRSSAGRLIEQHTGLRLPDPR